MVYDTNGAVVVGAKIKTINKDGESFEAKSNNEGIYLLNLLPEFYKVELEQAGFKVIVIENFQLVNSTYGKINRDFVLTVDNSNCGAGGCIEEMPQPKPQKAELSDKILQRPLEKSPKAKLIRRKNKE